jgi:methionine-gamma-lyase
VSLGGVSTLIEVPAFHSHASMTKAARVEAGISNGLIRLSIGLEEPEDIVNDLIQGLELIRNKKDKQKIMRSVKNYDYSI